MLSESYRDCIINPQQEVGFLIHFFSGAKVLIKDAKFLADCQKRIDRQLIHLAIEKGLGNQ